MPDLPSDSLGRNAAESVVPNILAFPYSEALSKFGNPHEIDFGPVDLRFHRSEEKAIQSNLERQKYIGEPLHI